MKSNRTLQILGPLSLVLAVSSSSLANEQERTVQEAAVVLDEFLDLQMREIPAALLAEAHGVAIIPDVIKVGLVVGGQRGKGVIIVREKEGSWRAPMFVTITGGSVGWQIGAQATDIVLVFKTKKSVDGLMRGKFTIGADASAAAGPVGRRAAAATDSELKAEIYSYSRSRGLFAGISLDGSALQIDENANAAYYGVVEAGQPAPPPPESAVKLVELVAQLAAGPDVTTPLTPTTSAPPSLRPALARDDRDGLRNELARSMIALSAILDDSWRRYLALPAEVYASGEHPSPEAVQAALSRFRAVAADGSYRALIEREEFQAAKTLLETYAEALTAFQPAIGNPRTLNLPPPPGTRQR